MKKALALLLATGSLLCFTAGCGDSGSDKDEGSSGKENSQVETVNTAEAKEKIEAADKAADVLQKAVGSAYVDLDSEGKEDISGTYWLTGKNIGQNGETLPYGDEMKIKDLDALAKRIGEYFSGLTELEEAGVYVVDSFPKGVYVKTSDGYFGTYPGGLISPSDYTYNEPTVDDCVKLIEKEVGKE